MTEPNYQKLGEQWMNRILASAKREDDWMKAAEKAEKIYLADTKDGGTTSFNILHSNVETMVPAIYNSTPVADVRPRASVDEAAKVVGQAHEALITAQIDDNRLDIEVEANAQDAFLAGRGIVRVRFDADVTQQVFVDAGTGEPILDEDGNPQEAEPLVENERTLYEAVAWCDYRQGPGKRWSEVPWVAYRYWISNQDREELEDAKIKKARIKEGVQDEYDEDQECAIWEIWCKEKREVIFLIEDSSRILSIKEDPLGLQGFFPQPAPIRPIGATKDLTPVCPYSVYEKLAKEVDTATKRIDAIMKGLKVRGGIVTGAEAISNIAEAQDNELVPISNVEGLMSQGGIEKAVVWWPVDKAIQVLRELYTEREQTKQAIYEITGISDIVRGQGAASETATAQQIKTQWGSLRIKKMQHLIQRQVRELMVLTAEIAARHFSRATVQKVSGIQLSDEQWQLFQTPLDHYRIDIETDSTVRADLTKSRQEMSEFLQGTAQFFQTMAPLAAQAPESAEPLAKMYAAFASQFNLGKQAEDALDQFVEMARTAAQQPQKPTPNPEMELEAAKLKADIENRKVDTRLKGAELQIKNRELGVKETEAHIKAAQAVADIEDKAWQHSQTPQLVSQQ